MRRPLILRVLLLFLPLAILVGVAARYAYTSEAARRHASLASSERARVHAGALSIYTHLDSIHHTLLFLANQRSLRLALDSREVYAPFRVSDDWVQFARTEPMCDQIRWLDETGMERIRVNNGGGRPEVVPRSALQSKADRYYFRATRDLARGEIYVSPMDLNVEGSRIEVPHKPTLRLATPVYDLKDQRRGLLVINYRGDALLARFARTTLSGDRHAWLLDPDGFWLKGTEPEDEWGFMFGRAEASLAHRHPSAWPKLAQADQGQFETPEGLWTFQTLTRDLAGSGLEGWQPQAPQAVAGSYGWKAVSLLPRAQYDEGLAWLAQALGWGTVLLLLILFLGLFRLVQARLAETRIRSALEARVAERTRDLALINAELQERLIETRRLWTAIEQAAEAVLITDARGLIQYVNPAFTDITGYPAEEAVGRTPRILKSGNQDASFYAEMWRTLLAGHRWKGRVVNRRKDGALFTEDTTISPILDPAGHTLSYVSVGKDITEELELEAQFRQAQKMDAVGRLAGGVAHDLNNLLVPILVNCELIQPQLGNHPSLEHSIGQIAQAGERAKDIVHQLLAFSRKQTLRLEVTDLNQIITRFGTLLRRIIREDVEIRIRLNEVPLPVRADIGQIEQVIMNLAVNAQDAMPRGGSLTFETALVELDETYTHVHKGVTPGPHVVVTVTDTGMGMDHETSEKIFEPFFTTKAKGQGTGLGLATVFGIVKQHQGSIWVYSEPGHGSSFKVYLPLAAGELEPEQPGAAVADRQGTETVLVVEDDASVRDLAVKILVGYGYTVLSAGDAQEALDQLATAESEVQLLLTDVILPGLNGRELFAQVNGRSPGIRVLYMSGYTGNVIGDQGLLDEGTQFIQKPFSLKGLAAKVREVLDA